MLIRFWDASLSEPREGQRTTEISMPVEINVLPVNAVTVVREDDGAVILVFNITGMDRPSFYLLPSQVEKLQHDLDNLL